MNAAIIFSIMCIFILVMVNGVCLREVAYSKAILKKADKLSKIAGTIQVKGTVSEIGSTGIDVRIDYAVWEYIRHRDFFCGVPDLAAKEITA